MWDPAPGNRRPFWRGIVACLERDVAEGTLSAGERLPTHRELADRLGLSVGDTVNLMSPAGKESAAGFSPKVKTFVVCGMFRSGMYEYDSTLAYVSIPAAQELLGFKRDIVTGIELKANDVDAVDVLAPAVRTALGGPPAPGPAFPDPARG